MILSDLHSHTYFSHAADSPVVMRRTAQEKGLRVFGFSEHSPRPAGYTYASDYQEKLSSRFQQYIKETQALCLEDSPEFTTLIGLEADFIPAERAFTRELIQAADFDYIIGGLHFSGAWGFDAGPEDWAALSKAQRFACYNRYYEDLAELCSSDLADIVAHPDLIKIFSKETFDAWLKEASSLRLVRAALEEVKTRGLLMELSSAGLRKACREPYPGPRIMELAADLDLPLCISSDAHAAGQIAQDFPALEGYARAFGFTEYFFVQKRKRCAMSF